MRVSRVKTPQPVRDAMQPIKREIIKIKVRSLHITPMVHPVSSSHDEMWRKMTWSPSVGIPISETLVGYNVLLSLAQT